MEFSRRRLLHQMSLGAAASALLPMAGRRLVMASAPDLAGGHQGAIRLDRNENPWGPSEKTVSAMQTALRQTHRYPDAQALQEKIAGFHKIKAEQVLLGCGSSELLRMAADALLASGKKLVLASPTFGLMSQYARLHHSEVVEVPLTSRFEHDLQAMLAKCDSSVGLVYICNPNNPTGSLTGRQELEEFLRGLPTGIPVLLDEAYHDYAGAPGLRYASFIDRPVDDQRLIVTRTFSKIHGLAGLRIGYAVASAEMVRQLSPRRLQYDVNGLGLAAAIAALEDEENVQTSARRNAEGRQQFLNLAISNRLHMVDSHTNFVLLNVRRPADTVIDFFRKQNVLLGPSVPSMSTHVRISIGLPEEMVAFWRVWAMLPGTQGPHH